MKNNRKTIKSILFAGFIASLLASCSMGDGEGMELKDYSGKDFHITSNKEESIDLLNELNKRVLRYDEETRIGDIEIPEGNSFNMGYQTSSLVWHNATEEGVGEDKIFKIYNGFLKTMTQDDYGYIYDNASFRESEFASNNEGLINLPQGWPFPYWKSSTDDSFAETVSYDNVHFTTFEFDTVNDPTSDNWVATNGTCDIEFNGYMDLSVSNNIGVGDSFKVYNEKLWDLLKLCGGIDAKHAPMLEIDLDFSSTNLDDYYLIWQTKDGGDTWFRASSKEYVTIYNDYFASYGARTYWPMYLNPNWNEKIITSIGLEFVPKANEKLNLTGSRIKYIRPSYDTRQPQFTFQWLESFYDYVMYTRDLSALKELMPKARRALSYLTHCLKGEEGLLNLDYLYGHNGIGTTINADGTVSTHPGEGIGSSYWDVLALPTINLESNAYFYEAVKEMAVLESVSETKGLQMEEISIKNREIGGEKVLYSMNSSKLNDLASTIKTNIEKDIKPIQKEDGSFTNEGGLWNPKTGRFALGVRESDGAVIDHGYVYFNEQAVSLGLGTNDQQMSIMKWIDGQRIVETDLSKGKDIYFYEFAPRFTTVDNTGQINFPLAKAFFGEGSNFEQYGTLFSRQVQTGGAVLGWGYYDVLARAKVLGAENAYKRIEEIASWYKKVKDNTEGEGTEFFSNYYTKLADNDENGYYVIQNADDRPGAVGLDGEFLENSMIAKIVPDALFGMNVSSFDNLTFTNSSLSSLKAIRLDNLKFGNATYSVKMEPQSTEISSLRGGVHKDTKVTLRFKKPKGDFKVSINGSETSDFSIDGDYVVVEVALANLKVSVR